MAQAELGDDEDDDEDPEAEAASFKKAVSALVKRCELAKLKFEHVTALAPPPEKYLRIQIPAGRDHKSIDVMDSSRGEALLSIPFEDFVFVDSYLAIRNIKTGDTEAAIDSDGSIEYLLKYALPRPKGEEPSETLTVSSPDSAYTLVLGPPSTEFRTLSLDPISASLKIVGMRATQNDHAARALESIAAAFLFDLDQILGASLRLQRHRPRTWIRRRIRRRMAPKDVYPQYPRTEYDFKPLSLYWYARSARGMPLVQFLAYYQILEFYFPTCSQAEARRRVRLVLQDPTFRPARDADIGRLLSTVRVASTGRGFGDERSQLRATIQECLDQDDLRAFLTVESRKTFYTTGEWAKLSAQKLSVSSLVAELRTEVADRIYDIRCRIVHAKGSGLDGDSSHLLPFTEEADLLGHDIDLVHYASTRVLIAMGSALHA